MRTYLTTATAVSAVAGLLSASPSAGAATLPTTVGQCVQTTVAMTGTRLEDGAGHSVPGSGSAISYADGGVQVSYDEILGIDHARVGDPVNLCLLSLPQNCPPGDDRGKIYRATNLRTEETWDASDSEHSCGGA